AIGIEAELQPGNGSADTASVTVIDKTAGKTENLGRISVETIAPHVAVRAAELAENEIVAADLDGGTITLKPEDLSETVWTIKSHQAKPSPKGEADGEYLLFLESAA